MENKVRKPLPIKTWVVYCHSGQNYFVKAKNYTGARNQAHREFGRENIRLIKEA